MIASINKLVVVLLLITTFTSCNQGPTLQTYFVDNELKPGFATFDVPTSVVDVEHISMTDEQKKAYNSVDKLNVLTFMKEDTEAEEYTVELEKVKTILENPKYEELIRGGNTTDGKFVVKFLGDIESIDELIIFGNANNKGFMIARVLGDGMNAKQLMTLGAVLENANFDDANFKGLTDFFK
ncbi:uncharacterized protein DUF4252 [Winogradskyella epiphytica]|uniref:Uncharacterized protein DUF4252 n=1 Tax=Winogradskyella epiphytica TaxID=262005 RepID=A0A2V4XSR0_9FLAO|nr:DUF4252 domain-containing protein [Winogradskyella epiphytica]PYE81121.1 uncharacterized protein DUF4252 [Winogradskyella epiphytica]GGW67001.1 hypothetical protein GCM10008085_18630 [Winogradskyella epiphytica]